VNAAVAAAKEAFPKPGPATGPRRAREARAQARRPDRAHVPEIAQTETNDTGQVIAQTGKQLVPRAADNFYYFAEMCTRVDGHTYPTAHAPELHAVPSGGRLRADLARGTCRS
jgi:5-carboxymethyl-2-hydroxymuconic-semialdehyde dehydrogenase